MKVIKILLGLVVVSAIVIAVVFAVLLGNINQIVKDVVQEQGSNIVKVPVSLAAVDISLENGRGQLSGLQVANPNGYSTPYAIQMGTIVLQIDTATVLKNEKVKVIKNITINQAKVIAEQSAESFTRTNLQDIADKLSAGNSTASDDSKAQQSSDIRLMVEQFNFTNGDIRLVSKQFGERTIKMPDIKLRNIGDKKNGLTPEQLGQAVMGPILEQVKKHAQKELTKIAKDKAKEKLKSKLEEKLLKKLGGGDKASDKLNKLKDLFGK